MFDEELVPEELTQVRLGKIIKDKYPELDEEDQEVVRQHAITALNLTQQAKQVALGGGGGGGDAEPSANAALIDGVRRFAMDVRELDIDLIDPINPVIPREWFLVPVFVVDEAVERIKDGTITN